MKYKQNFLLDTKLSVLDPDMDFFIRAEEKRQVKNLLMIASESLCPRPVRETLTSLFTNKYAEGYPSLRMTVDERIRIEKEPERYLAFHRRYGDRRFYKGAEYCNFIEVLAQRRAAEIFANPNAPVDNIFVNVQPLSGAAANNAVYNAFLTPGDTIMGMSLSYGGHLTHGSPFNRSGRQYKVIPYTVDPKTGQFDYDLLEKLAIEHKPKIIIAGASAYPWTIDWSRLKSICQKVPIQIPGLNQSGALLMADISHPAGLVVAELFPNPVGIADITTFTTHKTLCGPRGAVIISTEEDIAKRIDLGVFPGEQGGPHLNNIAAKAVCFKIASTQTFKNLQQKIVGNCRILAEEFKKLGLTLAYGGTNTHMVLIDLDSIKTSSGIALEGDVASNILDLCGITCNKNALPGDETGARPRGIRFGTTILSQLGMGKNEMVKIAHLVYDIISNIRTFAVISHSGKIVRGKIDIQIMEKVRNEVDKLLGNKIESKKLKENIIEVRGERATAFLQSLVNDNLYQLKAGQSIKTILKYNVGKSSGVDIVLKFHESDLPDGKGQAGKNEQIYWLMPPQKEIDKIFRYFKGLSDGYISFDNDDVYVKVEGPVIVRMAKCELRMANLSIHNPQSAIRNPNGKPEFVYTPYQGEPRRTSLYEEHLKLTKPQFIVPFAGWSMPLWYTRASEEHQAVRSAAGLFDVSHMGKLEISGYYATRFIDLVTTNYVPRLKIGQSHYSYIFNPDGDIMDDILLYRLSEDKYLMVVNAVNKEKIHQWLDAVNSHQFIIDRDNPNREMENSVVIKDRAEQDPIVNVALQGPAGLKILLSLTSDSGLLERSELQPTIVGSKSSLQLPHYKESAKKLRRLKKAFFITLELGGINALIARTGYTGEEIAYEIFVPKADAVRFWNLLLETGKELGVKPCGLAARDSLRTEAGLPLYGHELAGENSITPFEANYGAFVKRHKPFFIGRKAYIRKDKQIHRRIVRFKVTTPNARAIKTGDAVLDKSPLSRGVGVCNDKIGVVTSCTLAPLTGQATLEQSRQGQNAQIGLALIEKKYVNEGATLQIIPTPRPGSQTPSQPVQAVIITRFMTKNNS